MSDDHSRSEPARDAAPESTADGTEAPTSDPNDPDGDATAAEGAGPVILSLRGVEKRYGDVVALDGVDLDVRAGEFHCLVGPNGSGKSTLLRIVLGLLQPSAGTVDLPDGGVGCGFQRGNFYRGLTVAENLDVFGALMGADDAAWRAEVVETLRLHRVRDRVAGDLSGGFAKKLDLALAMLDRPDVLFLDEPFGDLDDVSKERLLEFLAAYSEAGNAVVVSTHHLGDFEPLVDRLTILHDGTVIVDEARAALDLGEHDSLQSFYLAQILALERRSEPPTDTATASDRADHPATDLSEDGGS
jgi:ABC-2 type transport system ATP-binding protein